MPTFVTGTKLKWKYFVHIGPFKISGIPFSGSFFRVVKYNTMLGKKT